MSTVLQVKNLMVGLKNRNGVSYPVEQVNFEIQRGETLALVGESGSGKSMTALSIMGLLQSWNSYLHPLIEGEVEFTPKHGKTIRLDKLTEKEFDRIRGKDLTMIFQEPLSVLNPVVSVGKQIAEVILAHEKIRPADVICRVIDLMESVGIPDPAGRYNAFPHQFSGGQLQRITIAMAIACDTSCLIADEPTTALDVTIQAQILDLLKKLQQDRKMGILLITHDFGVVSEFADNVAVMYAGHIVEYAAAHQIFSSPRHPYTRLLISSIPTLETIPGKRLPTKDDFLSARGSAAGSRIFDPQHKLAATFDQVAAGHYVSTAFMREACA
ncbi:MAG: ABC transporter ATP-binding protein [Peptococcaceae bacterium]|nr:ABC transporter ATP-binding protein [Peptococcaceae bacterium]